MTIPFRSLGCAVLLTALFCPSAIAEPSLALLELSAMQDVSRAQLDRADAQQRLSEWKLAQLRELRSQAHASWQEVAQQQAIVKSNTARTRAAKQFLDIVVDCRRRIENEGMGATTADVESIGLFLAGSVRLVASIPVNVAATQLVRQHLENLQLEHDRLTAIDLAKQEQRIKKLDRAIEVYGRSPHTRPFLQRTRLQLQLARAEFDEEKAKALLADVVAKRIELAKSALAKAQSTETHHADSPIAIARPGTPFADATSSGELASLVTTMAADVSRLERHLKLLRHQREATLRRVEALAQISIHPEALQEEIRQQRNGLSVHTDAINQLESQIPLHLEIAADYAQSLAPQGESVPMQAVPTIQADRRLQVETLDASSLRRWLTLTGTRLQTEAMRVAIDAQLEFLLERERRIRALPDHARAPKEVEHVGSQIAEFQKRREVTDHSIGDLTKERRRLEHQFAAERHPTFQIVQTADGDFVSRSEFEWATTLVASVHFLGPLSPPRPTIYPYLESVSLLSRLATQPRPVPYVSAIDRPTETDLQLETGLALRWGLASQDVSSPFDRLPLRSYRRMRSNLQDRHQPEATRWTNDSREFRTFQPYDRYPWGPCGLSIFYYRVVSPTRSSFPYRSNYLFRTAFPVRSNLYSSPYTRPASFRGFGYPSWHDESCFD